MSSINETICYWRAVIYLQKSIPVSKNTRMKILMPISSVWVLVMRQNPTTSDNWQIQDRCGWNGSGRDIQRLRTIPGRDFHRRDHQSWLHTTGDPLDKEEVFVSEGAKPDTGNIQEIFGVNNVVAITDPHTPVYVESNMYRRSGRSHGRRW